MVRSDDPGPSIWAKNRGWTPLLLSHTRDYGLYLESLLELQWGAVTRPRFAAAWVHELLEARDDKRLLRLQKQLAKQDLLIVDELGFATGDAVRY